MAVSVSGYGVLDGGVFCQTNVIIRYKMWHVNSFITFFNIFVGVFCEFSLTSRQGTVTLIPRRFHRFSTSRAEDMVEDSEALRGRIAPEQRRRLISQIIQAEGAVNTELLATRFDVSYMTIWRDISILEEQGSVARMRGGAMRPENDESPEPAYRSKQLIRSQEKEAIARYAAARFVTDNDIVILEAGTTVAAMIKHLDQANLTVVTNGVQTIVEASSRLPRLTVMSCGGILREPAHSFVGPQAERFFADLHARTLFLGATGLSLPEGITDPNPLEIQVKRAMAASAEQIILLMDSSKLGARSLLPVLPLERITALVTDSNATQEHLAALADRGIDVHVA
jgi:DeoR/GlpR family transcriptional regulator of sugar metabolism